MHVEFLVEERSAEEALKSLVPGILGPDVTFAIHAYQGKQDLLGKLPNRLKAYRSWLPRDWRIAVLVDGDDEDCRQLKATLDGAARTARLRIRSAPGSSFQVLNRLAIEELEAWFFGDIDALHAAYPRIDLNLGKKAKYRDPDAIKGGTWEALERELSRLGYHGEGLPKIAAARAISAHMVPKRNRPRSFRTFREGLLELVK